MEALCNLRFTLEHFPQSCSVRLRPFGERSFWLWALFRLGYRPPKGMRSRQNFAQNQKSSLRIAT